MTGAINPSSSGPDQTGSATPGGLTGRQHCRIIADRLGQALIAPGERGLLGFEDPGVPAIDRHRVPPEISANDAIDACHDPLHSNAGFQTFRRRSQLRPAG